MASLTGLEQRAFERVLGVDGGHVLNFSNRTFSAFILDSTRREIYGPRCDYGSGPKANRLRGFTAKAPDHVVAKLMGDLID